MIVVSSTQDLNKWNFENNPTELNTYIYSNTIVEDTILGKIKKKLHNIQNQDDASKINETENLGNIAEVKKFYGFRNTAHYSKKTQRWIGYVTKIGTDTFTSRLDDLTNPGTYEIGEFDLSDVSPEDLKLLEVGALFYWSIGDTMTHGQLKKESIIRFKRSSALSESQIDAIEDRAEEILKSISWE